MYNIYFISASVSASSSATIISEYELGSTNSTSSLNNNSPYPLSITYTDVTLEISASKYLISGSSNYLDYTRVYIKSGSITYTSFPLENTNIIYYTFPPTTSYDPNPPTSSVTPYIYINLIYTSNTSSLSPTTSSIKILSGSSTVYSSSFINDQSIFSLIGTGNYNIILSGSGNFYTSSITIYDTQNANTISYVTGSNIPITSSLSSSLYYNTTSSYRISAQTQQQPYIQITYDSVGNIPVSPTNSLSGWNTYLNITASSIVTSGSTVYVIGGDISSTITTLSISSSYITNFSALGLNNLYNLSLNGDGKLSQFPTLYNYTTSSLQYISFDSNQISSSILNFTSSQNLQTFIGSRNYITGSIQNLLSILPTASISYIDINNNKITGSISNFSSSFNIQYFNCSYNNMSGSIINLDRNYNLQTFICNNNALVGNIPDLSNCYGLQTFNCSVNNLSGFLPSFTSSYNLTYFNCQNNKISGSIPNLSSSIIETFNCSYNNLTGSIDLSGSSNLVSFTCNNNQLSGSINSLEGCVSLSYFNYSSNSIFGDIPRLTYASNLTNFICDYNGNLQDYIYINDILPATLLNFQAYGAGIFKQSAVDGILYGLDAAGGISGSVNLSGSTNNTPTSTGYSYTASLKSKGWTVYTN